MERAPIRIRRSFDGQNDKKLLLPCTYGNPDSILMFVYTYYLYRRIVAEIYFLYLFKFRYLSINQVILLREDWEKLKNNQRYIFSINFN